MRIPSEIIDDVRNASDIVEIVGGSVQLKKRGKNYIGLCPFHTEKTPSFTVSAEKQMYHCFGCGKGGNVFTFVMEIEKVSFLEAVRSLARRAGIQLPETTAQAEQSSEIENLYNACRFAGLFFHHNLTQTEEGRTALEYFHRRGFNDDTIRTFGLGYSLAAWDGLLKRAAEEGISVDVLLKAGLVRVRDDGSYYDYFRGRAMFPVFSAAGRVVGFGARKLRDDDPLGKYINSPETPLYNKSRILYGLFQAKEALRTENRALLVEGYVDLLSLFQAGIQNVVATSGTALTSEQLQLLGRYTKNLTLVFDADAAGSQATLRGVDLALENDMDVAVLELPAGEDPDSFIKKFGGKQFRSLLAASVSFIEYNARQYVKSGKLLTPEGQAEMVRGIVASIAKMRDELKRTFYIRQVAEKFELHESILYRELERIMAKGRRLARQQEESVQRLPVFDSPMADVTPPRPAGIPAAERDILKALMEGPPEVAGFIFSATRPDDFSDDRVRRLVEYLRARTEAGSPLDPPVLLQDIEQPELQNLISDIAMSEYELSRGWSALSAEIEKADAWMTARAAVRALRRQGILKQIDRNQRLLKDASEVGAETIPFVQHHQQLLAELRALDAQSTSEFPHGQSLENE